MKTEWFFAWYNLIFIVPFLLALLYVGVYAVSGLTFGDADVDHDIDADADAHFETDAHVDADADADADGHLETDAHIDADADTHVEVHGEAGTVAHGSVLAGMMSLLGVGRVPLSILLMVLLITWGVIGFVTNYVLYGKVGSEVVAALIAVCIAAVGSGICTRAMNYLAPLVKQFCPSMPISAWRPCEIPTTTCFTLPAASTPISRRWTKAPR